MKEVHESAIELALTVAMLPGGSEERRQPSSYYSDSSDESEGGGNEAFHPDTMSLVLPFASPARARESGSPDQSERMSPELPGASGSELRVEQPEEGAVSAESATKTRASFIMMLASDETQLSDYHEMPDESLRVQ
jgi:hypothetical protein